MTDNDQPEFNALLSDTFAGYSKVITPGTCRFYFAVLCEFELKDIAKAIFFLAKNDTSKIPPSAGEIHSAIVGGNIQERASAAWQEVYQGISRFGRYKSVCFTDPAINKVVEELGWESICAKTTEELGFLSHEFKKIFASYCKTPPTHFPTHVRGVIEMRNPEQEVRIHFVGEERKARLVYENGVPSRAKNTVLAIR